MPLGSTLFLLLVSPFLLAPAASSEPDDIQVSIPWFHVVDEDWRSLDDPAMEGLPAALRKLPPDMIEAFAAVSTPRLLLARRVGKGATPIGAFMADEEAMNHHGEFIPLSDRHVGVNGREAIGFECEWLPKDAEPADKVRVAALYAQADKGAVDALWILTTDKTPIAKLLSELASTIERRNRTKELGADTGYAGVLLGHDVSFHLSAPTTKRKAKGLAYSPTATPADAEFLDAIAKANPSFSTAHIHRWSDDERRLSLSYQVYAHDANLGAKDPFVHWLAGVFQQEKRIDEERGDFPVELLHVEDARTQVLDDERLAKHYENNKRAPEAGVILQVFLPRSPYARVCRIRFTQGEGEELRYGMVRFVELRDYRRSRSEIITRLSVAMLLGFAKTEADLDQLEEGLDFACAPRDEELVFPGSD